MKSRPESTPLLEELRKVHPKLEAIKSSQEIEKQIDMIYKPEREYHLTIDNYEVNNFIRVWVNYNVRAEKLIIKIFQAMGFTKLNEKWKDGFKAEKTDFNVAFAESMKAALAKGEFPATIPYIPRYNLTKESVGLDHFTIAYLYKKKNQGNGHTAQLEDSVVILETKNPRREAVAWLYYFLKLKNLDEDYLIDVPNRAKRTEANKLINGKTKKVVLRLSNPFGSFGKMMSLEGLDADSNLNLIYSDNAAELTDSQTRKRDNELASKPESNDSPKVEFTIESDTQQIEELKQENIEKQPFASSQEMARKGELAVASLQETARKSEVSNESLRKIEEDENSFEKTIKGQSSQISQTTVLSGALKKIKIKQVYEFTREFEIMEFNTWNEANHFLESYPAKETIDDRIEYQIIWEHDKLSGQLLLDQSDFNPKIVSNVIGKAAYKSLLYFQYYVEGRFGDYEPSELKELKLESKKYSHALKHYFFDINDKQLLKENNAKVHIINIEVEGSMLSLYEMTNHYEGIFGAANGKLESFAKMKEANQTASIKASWHDGTRFEIEVPYSSLPETMNRNQWVLWIAEHIGSDIVYLYQTEDDQPILFDHEINFPEPEFYYDTLTYAYWEVGDDPKEKLRLDNYTYHKEQLAETFIGFLQSQNLKSKKWEKIVEKNHSEFGDFVELIDSILSFQELQTFLESEIDKARVIKSPERKNILSLLHQLIKKGKKINSLASDKVTNEPLKAKTNQKELVVSEDGQEPLNDLEIEELFKNCMDSLDKLLPDLQKHLQRGVKKAQSILPFGDGQEVINFSMLDQRNNSIYLLELEFRTSVSTSNAPIVIQFLFDFEERAISINNYFNDPQNSYDGQKIVQFIRLFKNALEKSLEVGHQFDLASATEEANEKDSTAKKELHFYSLLAQAYWRDTDQEDNKKFELKEHHYIYHVDRLAIVINDYLNGYESFFRDHPSLNQSIDNPPVKIHPLKGLRSLYAKNALDKEKLKEITFICKRLVPRLKPARTAVAIILQSMMNDSKEIVDLPLLVIKEDKNKSPKTKKRRVKLNKEIEAFIDEKGTESKDYTQKEIALLSQYSGYGGSKVSEINKGLLYEYYTPDELVRMMWILAREFGYNNGSVLEPSCGTGNFIRYAPIGARIEGYETNKYSATICQLQYPHATIHNKSFENLFFNGNIYLNGNFRTEPFDLVIGNPPYGEFTGTYAGMGEKKRTKAKNYEHYFIKRGLDLLNPEGLLVYVIPNSFLANGNNYNSLKGEIALKCTIEFGFRLSSEVFQHTSIETDIIVLRKRKN